MLSPRFGKSFKIKNKKNIVILCESSLIIVCGVACCLWKYMSRALEIRRTINAVVAIYHNNYSWFREVDDRPGLRLSLIHI